MVTVEFEQDGRLIRHDTRNAEITPAICRCDNDTGGRVTCGTLRPHYVPEDRFDVPMTPMIVSVRTYAFGITVYPLGLG